MKNFELIVDKIKQKKELSGISREIIKQHLKNYLSRHKFELDNLNKSQLQVVVKDIRAVLRKNVGRFKASLKDRYKLFEKGDISELLKTHASTKERLDFYPALKEIIKSLKARSILDLGCGINPLALAKPAVKYYASDINSDDLKIVELFFKKNKIKGKVFVCDLNKVDSCSFPEADLVLILKVFDILGEQDYKTAMKILEKIHCKNLIVSFSTITLSGKRMRHPRRIWFERLLSSMLYKFKITFSDNEIFYII